MITLHRFVGLIETHSNELASHLLDRIRNSEATPDYHLVPDEDLREVVYEIYRHLGEWLMTRDEFRLGTTVPRHRRPAGEACVLQSGSLGDRSGKGQPLGFSQETF